MAAEAGSTRPDSLAARFRASIAKLCDALDSAVVDGTIEIREAVTQSRRLLPVLVAVGAAQPPPGWAWGAADAAPSSGSVDAADADTTAPEGPRSAPEGPRSAPDGPGAPRPPQSPPTRGTDQTRSSLEGGGAGEGGLPVWCGRCNGPEHAHPGFRQDRKPRPGPCRDCQLGRRRAGRYRRSRTAEEGAAAERDAGSGPPKDARARATVAELAAGKEAPKPDRRRAWVCPRCDGPVPVTTTVRQARADHACPKRSTRKGTA